VKILPKLTLISNFKIVDGFIIKIFEKTRPISIRRLGLFYSGPSRLMKWAESSLGRVVWLPYNTMLCALYSVRIPAETKFSTSLLVAWRTFQHWIIHQGLLVIYSPGPIGDFNAMQWLIHCRNFTTRILSTYILLLAFCF